MNFEIRIGRWRTVSLHTDEPRRRGERWDREGFLELVGEISRFLLFQFRFEFLSFVITIPQSSVEAGETVRQTDSSPNSVILGLV